MSDISSTTDPCIAMFERLMKALRKPKLADKIKKHTYLITMYPNTSGWSFTIEMLSRYVLCYVSLTLPILAFIGILQGQ